MQKERIISATILAVSIVILGFALKGGIDNFVNKDHKVTVKGLSEREVEADKVTWPILSKELGNDYQSFMRRLDTRKPLLRNSCWTTESPKVKLVSMRHRSLI